ncbi:MAG: hypothetical protein AAF692_13645 [Pseudomonadota bacterium]
MFDDWTFLIGEIWGLLLLAVLLGLLLGRMIWKTPPKSPELDEKLAKLQRDLEQANTAYRFKEDRVHTLEAEIASLRATAQSLSVTIPEPADALEIQLPAQNTTPNSKVKPATLAAARGGVPDDLTRIKGIGPKLAQLCHELGVYHFDQIASWTDEEASWVDANLGNFQGRVARDGWVDQARALASGASETL